MKEKFVALICFNLSNYLISALALYLLFLKLDLKLMGIFTLVYSIVNLGFIFYDLGFTIIHYRYSYEEKNRYQIFSTFLFIKLCLIIISVILSLILILIFQLWEYMIYFVLLILSMITLSLLNVLMTNLRSKKKILFVSISFGLYTVCKQIPIILISINISKFSDPLFLIFISNFSFELIYMLFLIIFCKNELLNLQIPKVKYILLYLKETKFISVRSIIFIFVLNFCNILIDYYYGHEFLAYISFIYQFYIFLLILSRSFIPIYLRFYSEYFEKNDIKSIREITHKVENYSSFLFLCIILVVFLNGRLILSIFLPNYINSLPGLYIIVFIPYFMGITRPYENQLIPGHKENLFALSGILIALIQLILIIFFIPKQLFNFKMLGLGIIGYSLAFTIPWAFYAIIIHYFSKKYFNINSQKQIFSHIIFAIIAYLISFLLKDFILILIIKNEILLLITSTIFVILLFFGLSFLFKQLNKNDIKFFIELFKIKLYRDALKEELMY